MQSSQKSNSRRIVIVGGGAGGLELATRLGRNIGLTGKATIILVDGTHTHIWKPLLHEVATGVLNTGEDEVNYFTHAYRNGYEFEFGFMQSLDRNRQCITINDIYGNGGKLLSNSREIFYDILVLAVGSQSNDFGTPGVNEYAMKLNTPEDAEKLRRCMLEHVFAISMSNDTERAFAISIVGGGATGVELAAELHHTMQEMHQYGSRLSPDKVRIRVIEGGERILPSAPPTLSSYANDVLLKRNIHVLTKSIVAEVTERGIRLADGILTPSDITVWAAGIKAPAWLANLDGLITNKLNQIKVTETLQTVSDARIYAIGDCAAVPHGNSGQFLPATAQVAHQQAKWLALAVEMELAGKTPPSFVYKPQGVMVSLGNKSAVGSLTAVVGPKRNYWVEGRTAKLIYASLYHMHQVIVHGWLCAWLLIVGDKLRGVVRPSVKLH